MDLFMVPDADTTPCTTFSASAARAFTLPAALPFARTPRSPAFGIAEPSSVSAFPSLHAGCVSVPSPPLLRYLSCPSTTSTRAVNGSRPFSREGSCLSSSESSSTGTPTGAGDSPPFSPCSGASFEGEGDATISRRAVLRALSSSGVACACTGCSEVASGGSFPPDFEGPGASPAASKPLPVAATAGAPANGGCTVGGGPREFALPASDEVEDNKACPSSVGATPIGGSPEAAPAGVSSKPSESL